MLSFLPTALCLMLTPDQHYLPFLIPVVTRDVTGCQGELGTASLGFGINSKHRRTTEAQGHLHHVNTHAKCVLNMPRTQALLIHMKTKILQWWTLKLEWCTHFHLNFSWKEGADTGIVLLWKTKEQGKLQPFFQPGSSFMPPSEQGQSEGVGPAWLQSLSFCSKKPSRLALVAGKFLVFFPCFAFSLLFSQFILFWSFLQ